MERIDIEREMVVRIFQVSNQLQMYIDKTLDSDNVTAKQFYLMIMISTFESNPTISECSSLMGTSRQNVKQLAMKLELNGFIQIQVDKKDNRIKRLVMTNKALDFWNIRSNVDSDSMDSVFGIFKTEELEVCRSVLSRISELIK